VSKGCIRSPSAKESNTDGESALLEPLISLAKPGGRPSSVHLLVILKWPFYVLLSGYQWRLLPRTCVMRGNAMVRLL
jgi:transposase